MSHETKILSKSAQSIQNALAEKGLELTVIELSSSTRTALDAAQSISCSVEQIMKSLLFHTATTRQPVLVLASGPNRVNEKNIEHLIGEKIVKADADFTREITGFAIGGIPPIGHAQAIAHTFIDEDLLRYETLWAAAGTPNAVFCLNSCDIEKLIKGKIITIK